MPMVGNEGNGCRSSGNNGKFAFKEGISGKKKKEKCLKGFFIHLKSMVNQYHVSGSVDY